MKKIILSLLLISFLAVPMIGLTFERPDPLAEVPVGVDPMEAIERIARLFFNVLMVVALIFIIIGAYTLVTAGGDDKKIGTGKTQVIYALVAVVVAVLAQAAITWIQGFFR